MHSDRRVIDYTCELCGWAPAVTVYEDELPLSHKCTPRGLGDTIAKAAAKAGIKPCGGCKQRQDLLNRVIPYKKG